MKRHDRSACFPGAGKMRPDNGARSGRSAAALVEPTKGLHEASRPIPVLSRGREISSGEQCAVRTIRGCSRGAASRPISVFPGGCVLLVTVFNPNLTENLKIFSQPCAHRWSSRALYTKTPVRNGTGTRCELLWNKEPGAQQRAGRCFVRRICCFRRRRNA